MEAIASRLEAIATRTRNKKLLGTRIVVFTFFYFGPLLWDLHRPSFGRQGKQKTVEMKLRTGGDQLLVELSNVLETRTEGFPAEAAFASNALRFTLG